MLTIREKGLDLSEAAVGDEFYIVHEIRGTHIPFSISRYLIRKVGKQYVSCFWMEGQPLVRYNKLRLIPTGALPGTDRVDEVIRILKQQEHNRGSSRSGSQF